MPSTVIGALVIKRIKKAIGQEIAKVRMRIINVSKKKCIKKNLRVNFFFVSNK